VRVKWVEVEVEFEFVGAGCDDGERMREQFGLACLSLGGRAAPSTHQPSTQYPAPGTSTAPAPSTQDSSEQRERHPH
jgi:hypothetical protein